MQLLVQRRVAPVALEEAGGVRTSQQRLQRLARRMRQLIEPAHGELQQRRQLSRLWHAGGDVDACARHLAPQLRRGAREALGVQVPQHDSQHLVPVT